jgi:hypothetical protein
MIDVDGIQQKMFVIERYDKYHDLFTSVCADTVVDSHLLSFHDVVYKYSYLSPSFTRGVLHYFLSNKNDQTQINRSSHMLSTSLVTNI